MIFFFLIFFLKKSDKSFLAPMEKVNEAWKATQYDRLSELESLSSSVSPNSSTYSETNHIHTLLMCAAAHGSLDCLNHLISKGANVGLKNFAGYTALHWAAYTGRTDSAEILISKGADTESRTEDGKTPLHIAALRGHLNFIKFLLKISNPDQKVDINSVSCNGWNALFFAVMSNQKAVAQFLIQSGIDTESPDAEKQTVFDIAEKYQREWISDLIQN